MGKIVVEWAARGLQEGSGCIPKKIVTIESM